MTSLAEHLDRRFPKNLTHDSRLHLDSNERYIAEVDRLLECEQALRFLGAFVAAGDYNTLSVEPQEYQAKIVAGIVRLFELARKTPQAEDLPA